MSFYTQLAKRFFPDADNKYIDYLLWSATSYPVGSVLQTARGLKKAQKADKENKSICMYCGEIYKRKDNQSFEDICNNCAIKVAGQKDRKG